MQNNYVVIGYGEWAKKIITINLNINKHFQLMGIFYRTIPKDNFYNSNRNIFYNNWKIMINKIKPKIVLIALPPFLNFEVINYLRKKKFIFKIFLEKPICSSNLDLLRYKNLDNQFKKKIFVNYLDIHSKSLQFFLKKKIKFNQIRMQLCGPSILRKDMNPLLEYLPHFLIFLILKIKNIDSYKTFAKKENLSKNSIKYEIILSCLDKRIKMLIGNYSNRKFRNISIINENDIFKYSDRSNSQLIYKKQNRKFLIFPREKLLEKTLLFFFNEFLIVKSKKNYNYIDLSIKVNTLIEKIHDNIK